MKPTPDWLLSLAVTIALATLLTGTLQWHQPDISAAALGLTLAALGCLVATLLTPQQSLRGWWLNATPGAWGPLSAAALTLVATLHLHLTASQCTRLGIALLLVMLLLGQLLRLLRLRFPEPAASGLTSLLALLFGAAPFLLGPLAGRYAEQSWLVGVAVNLSPLSFFASAIDYDYLRSNWFYQHLSLGSLRFEYAHPLATGGVISALALLLHLVLRLRSGPARLARQSSQRTT